ncbi:MAG TPA: PAS domain S-box protein, partial [Leptolyngbyaceae cyanobacterium]
MAEENIHRHEQVQQALSRLRQQLTDLALSSSQRAALMVTLNQLTDLLGSTAEDLHPQSRDLNPVEQDLLRNVGFIEQVIDASPQLLYIVDLERFANLYVNRQVETILGYTVAEVQAQGAQFFVTLVHPDDEPIVQAHFHQMLSDSERRVFELEYRARHADGTYRWLQAREMVFKRNSQGRAIQVLGMAVDVSHRKQAEIELRSQEEQLRQIVDHIDGCFFLRSAETSETLYISVGYEQLYGRPCEELYADPNAWIAAVHPEDRDRIRSQVADEQQGQYFFDDEYRIVRPDGTVRWIWNLSFPIYDEAGRMYRFAGFVRDITERKCIETALRKSEARFRSASEQSAVGICHCDESGRFLWVNPALCHLLGYTKAELLTMNCFDITHPDDLPSPDGQGRLGLKQLAQSACSLEKRYLRKNGEILWGHLTLSAVCDETKSVRYLTGIVQDITAQKQMEADLRRSLHEKDVLLAEVHHRVKNNLQIVSSLLELQANRTEDETAHAALISSQNRVIAMALIHETLYHSKDLSCIDFGQYIQQLAGGLFRAYEAETTLRLNLTSETCLTLPSDIAISLGLILNELVTNALKHGEFRHQKGTLEIGLQPLGQTDYSLWVSHQGDCLPPDFDLESSSSMGLKLVKLLVNRIRGQLKVERTPRTTFAVEFT